MIEYLKLKRVLIYEDKEIPLFVEFDYDNFATLQVSIKIPHDNPLIKVFNGNIISYIFFNLYSDEIEVSEFRNYLSIHDAEWDKAIAAKLPKEIMQYGKGFGKIILCLGLQYIIQEIKPDSNVIILEAATKELFKYYESYGFKLRSENGYRMVSTIDIILSHCNESNFYSL